jgi:hypothetical protein
MASRRSVDDRVQQGSRRRNSRSGSAQTRWPACSCGCVTRKLQLVLGAKQRGGDDHGSRREKGIGLGFG